MLNTIFHAVEYVVIPLILLLIFAFGIYVIRRVGREYRVSARAGLAAGLVVFAIYVISSLSDVPTPINTNLTLPSFNWHPAVIGAILGFVLLLVLARFERNAGLVGLTVLVLIASSSVAAFSYLFTSPLRQFAIYFSLSMLFGMLVEVMIFPDRIKSILNL